MVTILPKGKFIVEWVWGNYVIGEPTLRRFFVVHYLLPFVIAGVSAIHLFLLHNEGSNNPVGSDFDGDNVLFYPYFVYKDIMAFSIFLLVFACFVFFIPEYLNHPDNYVRANSIETPRHVVPEWYFLPFYAILRSIPHKTGGILAMFGSILVLFLIPFTSVSTIRNITYKIIFKFFFWLFVVDCLVLLWVGAANIEYKRYLFIGQAATICYYIFFIFILPVVSEFDKYFIDVNVVNESL